MKNLNLGAIAILDALGFKGIWAREDANRVLERFKSFRRKGLRLQGKDHGGALVSDVGFRHRVRCMSDTIVITVIVKSPNAPRRGLYKAILSASLIAGHIVMEGIRGSPPVLFRGCIAAGEMKEESDFLIGPAVDEAAEWHEKADGPFIWLTRSSLEIKSQYEDTFGDRLEPGIMLPYSVPLNDGTKIDTLTFTYFNPGREAESRAETSRHILRAFGQAPLAREVKRKKRNTHLFLKSLERIVRSGTLAANNRTSRLPNWNDLSFDQKMSLLKHGVAHLIPNSPIAE
jgi:hypothetical protein